MNQLVFKFENLETADLVVDAIYEGGKSGNAGDDPLTKLLAVGNQGGFRQKGSIDRLIFCVLYSDLTNNDWPDELDYEMGQFIYFGDNRIPGQQLHDTSKKGNLILKNVFDDLHINRRLNIPPFFIFTKTEAKGRSVTFRGLAVPGSNQLSQTDDLVAIWKSIKGSRFQNYRSVFTILNEPVIKRSWINSLYDNTIINCEAPENFKRWLETGKYVPLLSPSTVSYRNVKQQLPKNEVEISYINNIKNYFSKHEEKEYAFEKCASALVQLMDSNIISCNNTRKWRDGGRDALGVYRIGISYSYTDVEFALEAKCYDLKNGCGVKETSRLISRLRHRQFGIFVTTSYVSLDAYKEILEDKHPVLILSATDIYQILMTKGINTAEKLNQWLLQF
jgi:hypothetical protein